MQFSFDSNPEFTASIQENLQDITQQAFATCKVQFGSADDHRLPHCQFHMGGAAGNTGNLRGIHVTFDDQKHLKHLLTKDLSRLKQLIHHELVHFFQAHLHSTEPSNYLPQWFYEGMAVAFSGQSLIARNSHLDDDYDYVGPDASWERNFSTIRYTQGVKSSYDSWGAMFIYAVTDQPNILPVHAVMTDDGFHANVRPAECVKALAIIEMAFEKSLKVGLEKGFHYALIHHTGKEQITESGFREFLAQN